MEMAVIEAKFENLHQKVDFEPKETTPDLKEIWLSMFTPAICRERESGNVKILGILMLLHAAIDNVKQFASQNDTLLASYSTSLKELKEKDLECIRLRDNVERIEKLPCEKCSKLKSQLKDANRKAEEAQTRMNSIAKILALGGDDKQSQSRDKPGTVDLVTQMLLHSSESPKRKKRCSNTDQVVKRDFNVENVLVSASAEPFSCGVRKKAGGMVPETAVSDDDSESVRSPQKENPLVVESSPKKSPLKTRLSRSLNIPRLNKGKERGMLKTNRSADDASLVPIGKQSEESPQKARIEIDLDSVQKKIAADGVRASIAECGIEGKEAIAPLDNSLADWVKTNNSELERIWFDSDGGEGDEEQRGRLGTSWKLKEPRGVGAAERGGKRLRQTTLGVKLQPKMKEIKSRLGEEDATAVADIVSPSPRKIKPVKKKKVRDPDSFDLALFAPMATSTQVSHPKRQLESSFDRPPRKKPDGPSYKYKANTVRKKEEKAKLDGKKCEECEEYYKVAGKDLKPEEMQKRLNLCSRHRSNYVRQRSPPGMWDPNVPDTQECREKGLYTSVYRPREQED